MNLIASMIVSPVLPYWLRLRYKLYLLFLHLRRAGLIEKYRRMVVIDRWKKEDWTML